MSNLPTVLDFSEEENLFISIPVKIPGDSTEYTLKTFNGADATKFHNAQAKTIRFDSAGNPVGFNDRIADIEPLLISLCLWDDKGRKVSVSKIGSWPFPIQRKLYKTAQQINQIAEEERLSSLLAEAFRNEDNPPPCSLEELREWSTSLREDKWKPVIGLFSLTDEELVKNSLNETTDGLD
jgi:hypothetical protein